MNTSNMCHTFKSQMKLRGKTDSDFRSFDLVFRSVVGDEKKKQNKKPEAEKC